MRQIDIAHVLKVNRVNISNWENNKEIIPLDKLNLYANFFNTNIDYIVGLSNFKNNNVNNTQILDSTVIGKRIRETRQKFNVTQKELANILNTTQSTISDYENGHTLILTSFAYQICLHYKISMDWLCGRI